MSTRNKQQPGGLPAVVVPLPPAKPAPRAYADFDEWLALGNKLAEAYDRICELILEVEADEPYVIESKGRKIPCGTPSRAARGLLRDWPLDKLAAKAAEFVNGWDHVYGREELYEAKGENKYWRLHRRVICEQLAALIGSFPNAVPHSPEVYTAALIEEIVAANPGAVQLEAACRWLRRNCTFPPSIAEALKALRGVKLPGWDAFDEYDGELAIVRAHRELEAELAKLTEADKKQ